jgi:hypothetical protein
MKLFCFFIIPVQFSKNFACAKAAGSFKYIKQTARSISDRPVSGFLPTP